MDYELIVIGAGPGGCSAALYGAREGLTTLLVESAAPGGQMSVTAWVENYPGVPGASGQDLANAMLAGAKAAGATFLQAQVTGLHLTGSPKIVETTRGAYTAGAVVLAMGAAPRKLALPEAERFLGRGLSYCATCDGFFFRNKPIVVVGGGDSAFEEADFLSRFGSSVTLIHRRSTFRASRIMVERAQRNPKIDFMLDAVVQEIRGDENGVQEVEVRNTSTEKTSVIPANGVFVAIGHTPATAFLNGLVDVDSAGYITVDGASTRTSEPGVFAAGDCVDSVYRQAISAAGMGCRAALDAQAYLDSLK